MSLIIRCLLATSATLVAVAFCACQGSNSSSSEQTAVPQAEPPQADEVPVGVKVTAGRDESRLALSSGLHSKFEVSSDYRITKYPVSVSQYQACVRVGACSPNSDLDGLPSEGPVTLRDPKQAVAFCRWQSAALPSFEQWLHAARKSESGHRFAWGNSLPNCEQNPGALDSVRRNGCCVASGGQECGASLVVGMHPAGAAPSGMEDVLLTRAELLRSTATSVIPACTQEGECYVSGIVPGAIDSVIPVSLDTVRDGGRRYSFRCVWEN